MTVALVGYGALGKQVRYLLENSGKRDFILFDDPALSLKEPTARAFHCCVDPEFAMADFYICLGYLHLEKRREWLRKLLALGRRLPALVHPSSFVSPTARIGHGAIVYPGCNIDQHVSIGDGTLLNNSVVVSHDSEIGEGAFLAPGAIICGSARVGAGSFIGAGTVVSNGIRVGEACQVGAASLVAVDLPDGSSAIGNPLKKLDRPLKLT